MGVLYRFCTFIFSEQSVENLSVGNDMHPMLGHVCPPVGHMCPTSLLHAVLRVRNEGLRLNLLIMRYSV